MAVACSCSGIDYVPFRRATSRAKVAGFLRRHRLSHEPCDGMPVLPPLRFSAFHVDWKDPLRRGRWPIIILSTIRQSSSRRPIVAFASTFSPRCRGFQVPRLVVLSVVRSADTRPIPVWRWIGGPSGPRVPPTLQARSRARSCFNDGVGVVVFTVIVVAAAAGSGTFSPPTRGRSLRLLGGGGVLARPPASCYVGFRQCGAISDD